MGHWWKQEDCAYIMTNRKWAAFGCNQRQAWFRTLNALREKPVQP